jgi:hypothetical protein
MRCIGKERFTTQALAARVAALSMRRHEGARSHAYRCGNCGGFHVGSVLRGSASDDFKRERLRLAHEFEPA